MPPPRPYPFPFPDDHMTRNSANTVAVVLKENVNSAIASNPSIYGSWMLTESSSDPQLKTTLLAL